MPIDKEKEFKTRIDFSSKPIRPKQHGILADWDQIPKVTKAYRTGWKYSSESRYVFQGGVGAAHWNYKSKKGDEGLTIEVAVFSKGQAAAIERMIMKAITTTTMHCPYGAAREPVGDFAAMVARSKDTIFWVYYNVLVEIKSSDDRYNVIPMAKAIQDFMAKSVCTEIDKHMPRVERVVVTPPKVSVGKKFKIEAVLPEGMTMPDWMIDINESWDRTGFVDYVTRDGLTATFTAKTAGQGLVSVQVLDKKTLLSPVLEATVEIVAKKNTE